jgi:[CysO sulfur-carrier protein]-S-L-cysteine hydrolase
LFYLEKKYSSEMISHARSEAPNECCGILAGVNGKAIKLYRTTNAEHSPVRYNVEPQELFHIYQEIDKRGWELLGIYHSHPHSKAYPSATDIKYAFFPGSWYFIVSLSDPIQPAVRVFRIANDKIEEQELKVVE